jgi:hypothetical protein
MAGGDIKTPAYTILEISRIHSNHQSNASGHQGWSEWYAEKGAQAPAPIIKQGNTILYLTLIMGPYCRLICVHIVTRTRYRLFQAC